MPAAMLRGCRRKARSRVFSALLICAAALAPPAGPAAAAEPKPWSGGATPPLALTGLNGRGHDLATHRGKVVVVNFWATWCEPCRDEMPSLERLQKKTGAQQLAVLAVNVDEPESRIRKFLERTPLAFPVLADPERRATKAWNVRVLPTTFIVGRDGRIRYSVVGEAVWDDARMTGLIAALAADR
ncbi:MAG: TlpA family protein disulfide reductase [Burkholderiales bacterium]|nr:TlpA family protein disulfide reductase [Burkholderiales bacterium]